MTLFVILGIAAILLSVVLYIWKQSNQGAN
jgi:hypothetical protein